MSKYPGIFFLKWLARTTRFVEKHRGTALILCNVSVRISQLFSISDSSTALKVGCHDERVTTGPDRVTHDSVGLHQRLLSKSFVWNCGRARPGARASTWSRVVPVGAWGAARHRGAIRELGTVHALAQRDVILLHWHRPATLGSNDVLHRNRWH